MNPCDQCRLCNCNFKVKCDNFKSGDVSTENLFNPFDRKNCKGEVFSANLPYCSRAVQSTKIL